MRRRSRRGDAAQPLSEVDASDFYRTTPGPLDQGDILLAPLSRPLATDAPEPDHHLQASDDQRLWARLALPWGRSADVLVAPQAAMVVSHGCHLDKQYNQRVTALHRDGVPIKEAERQAEEDPTLDRWIVVAPILPIGAMRAEKAALRRGDVAGLLYVPAHADGLVPEPAIVDLAFKFTVDRVLTQRIVKLSDRACEAVRMALMRVDLARKPRWDALEHAVHSKLREAVVDERDPLRVRLRFANGVELRLVHPPAAGGPGGRTRL